MKNIKATKSWRYKDIIKLSKNNKMELNRYLFKSEPLIYNQSQKQAGEQEK